MIINHQSQLFNKSCQLLAVHLGDELLQDVHQAMKYGDVLSCEELARVLGLRLALVLGHRLVDGVLFHLMLRLLLPLLGLPCPLLGTLVPRMVLNLELLVRSLIHPAFWKKGQNLARYANT